MIDPTDTESTQINRALEMMFSHRGNKSNLVSEVKKAGQISTKLDLGVLLNRLNVDSATHETADFVVDMSIKICEISNKVLRNEYIGDLATVVCGIQAYSEPDYVVCVKRVHKILNKAQKKVFDDTIQHNHEVYLGHTIIGGTLDEGSEEQFVKNMAQNCMTTPARVRDVKIDETIHIINDRYEEDKERDEMQQLLRNEIERMDYKRRCENGSRKQN